MKITAFSDSHDQHTNLSLHKAEILIIAGDFRTWKYRKMGSHARKYYEPQFNNVTLSSGRGEGWLILLVPLLFKDQF